MSRRLRTLAVGLLTGAVGVASGTVVVGADEDPGDAVERLEARVEELEARMREIHMDWDDWSDFPADLADLADSLDSAELVATDGEADPRTTRSRRRRLDVLLQEALEARGRIRWNGSVTMSVQVDPDGKPYRQSAVGSLDLFASTTLGDGLLLFVDLEGIGGDGPDAELATLSGLNGDAGSTQSPGGIDRVQILEAWVELIQVSGVRLTVGKIDPTNYFDQNAIANDETTQFLSTAFVNSVALPVATNAPGFRALGTFRGRFDVQVVLVSRDDSGGRIFDDLQGLAGIGTRHELGGAEGQVQVFGTWTGEDLDGGWGVSGHQGIGAGLAVFGRWYRNGGDVRRFFPVEEAWSGGVQLEVAGEKATTIGVAYGSAIAFAGAEERLVEAYVRRPIDEWTAVSAHFQMIVDPAGTDATEVIAGVRTQFDF